MEGRAEGESRGPGGDIKMLGSSPWRFPAQVAVSSVADIRGGVPGDAGEPDGAAQSTDGEGHRVVPQTLGQDVPAGGREAVRPGWFLLHRGPSSHRSRLTV